MPEIASLCVMVTFQQLVLVLQALQIDLKFYQLFYDLSFINLKIVYSSMILGQTFKFV